MSSLAHCCNKLVNCAQVAERYKDERAMFFPHNLDFRGRAYTMHPHLSHLGNDICRGLLHFAEGKPLGEQGLEWLFIQVRFLSLIGRLIAFLSTEMSGGMDDGKGSKCNSGKRHVIHLKSNDV